MSRQTREPTQHARLLAELKLILPENLPDSTVEYDGVTELELLGQPARAAQAKAKPFDAKVGRVLSNIEQRRRMPVPKKARASLVATAILKTEGGNIESLKRRVRESLKRQGLW